MPRAWKVRIFGDHRRSCDSPRMIIVLAPDHICELRPRRECGCACVCGHKSLTFIPDKREQLRFLLSGQVDLPVAEKKDGVDIGEAWPAAGGLSGRHERRLRNDRGVRPYIGVVHTRFIAEPLDDSQRVGHGLMLPDAVTRVRPRENDLLIGPLSRRCAARAASLPTGEGAEQKGNSKPQSDADVQSHMFYPFFISALGRSQLHGDGSVDST